MREFFLLGDRLGFSTWTAGDKDLAHQLWGDPQVSRYICAAGVFTPEEIDERLELEMANQAKYGYSYWPIFTRGGGHFVGCCGLRPKSEGVLELGCHLLPRFWGQGYAQEGCRMVIRYAFETLGARALFCGHNPNNTASAKLIGKLGFTYLGTEFYPPTGLDHPSYEMKRPATYDLERS